MKYKGNFLSVQFKSELFETYGQVHFPGIKVKVRLHFIDWYPYQLGIISFGSGESRSSSSYSTCSSDDLAKPLSWQRRVLYQHDQCDSVLEGPDRENTKIQMAALLASL
jgi:hypothetical protein